MILRRLHLESIFQDSGLVSDPRMSRRLSEILGGVEQALEKRKGLDEFLALVPGVGSSYDPRIHGLSGSTILIDGSASGKESLFTGDGTNPRTLLNFLDWIWLYQDTLRPKLEEISQLLLQVHGKDLDRRFEELTDTPLGYVPGQYLKVGAGETGLEATDTVPADSRFLALNDTPDAFTGKAGAIIESRLDQQGTYLTAIKDQMPWEIAEIASDSTRSGNQVDRKVLLLDRTSPFTLSLDPAFEGSEVHLLSKQIAGSEVTVEATGGAALESGTFAVNDTYLSALLVYDTTNSKYWVLERP